MSLILDALRRRSRTPEPSPASNRSNQADTVLATLGYSRKRSADRFAPGQYLGYALALALVVGAAWGAYLWFFAASAAEPTATSPGGSVGAGPAAALPASEGEPTREPATADAFPDELSPADREVAAAARTATPARRPAAPDARAPQTPVPSPGDALLGPVPRPAPVTSVVSSLPAAGSPAPPTGQTRSTPSTRSTRVETPAEAPAAPPVSTVDRAVRGPGPLGADSEDHFRLAVYFHQAGDFENALLHYRALLEANELNAEAHNNLGLLYLERGLIDESVRRFHRAIIIDPQYVKAHNNLGVAYLRSGKPEAAAVEFRAALAADAKNVESWTNLAVVMIQTGRGDQAEEMLQRALALQPQHAASHYNLALVAEQRGDVETAIRHYRRFIDNSTPDQADLVAEARRRTTALEDQPAR